MDQTTVPVRTDISLKIILLGEGPTRRQNVLDCVYGHMKPSPNDPTEPLVRHTNGLPLQGTLFESLIPDIIPLVGSYINALAERETDSQVKKIQWGDSTTIHLHLWEALVTTYGLATPPHIFKDVVGAFILFDPSAMQFDTMVLTVKSMIDQNMSKGPVILLVGEGRLRETPQQMDKVCLETGFTCWLEVPYENLTTSMEKAVKTMIIECLKTEQTPHKGPVPFNVTARRLTRDFKRLPSEADWVVGLERRHNDIYDWDVTIKGPEGSPYEGYLFRINIDFTDHYPSGPPLFTFLTVPYHPDIRSNGTMSQWLRNGWYPQLTCFETLQKLRAFLKVPISTEWNLPVEQAHRANPLEFNKKAAHYCALRCQRITDYTS